MLSCAVKISSRNMIAEIRMQNRRTYSMLYDPKIWLHYPNFTIQIEEVFSKVAHLLHCKLWFKYKNTHAYTHIFALTK